MPVIIVSFFTLSPSFISLRVASFLSLAHKEKEGLEEENEYERKDAIKKS